MPTWLRRLARLAPLSAPRQRRPRLFVEPLEDRLTPSTLIPVTDRRDLVFDPGRNVLYITTDSGKVQRWDIASQQLLSPWTIGTKLNGADITPDDSSLYIAEGLTSGNQGFVHQVHLDTGSVTAVPYTLASSSEAGASDVTIGPGGKALVTTEGNGSGAIAVPLRQLDTTTNTYTIRTDDPGSYGNGQISTNVLFPRSADRSLFLAFDGGLTDLVFTYNAVTDQFSTSQAVSGYLGGTEAVSRNGTLMAVAGGGGGSAGGDTSGIMIFDRSFKSVQNLPDLTGGVIFDPNQDVLYGVNSKLDQIQAYDTNTWTLKYSFPTDEQIGGSVDFGTELAVSADSKYLFLTTQSGVREYSLPQATGVAAALRVTGFPTFVGNGVAGSLTVSAVDPANNVVPGYTGTIHFSSSSAGALPADYTFTAADHGTHTFSNVSLTYTGTQSITASDAGAGISGSQGGIVVHGASSNLLIPYTAYRDLVFDPTRNLLYITGTDGTVQRFDVASQTLLSPLQVGGSPNGADITPDGSSLYVADRQRGLTQSWFRDVNLSTGAVTNITYPISSNSGFASWNVIVGPHNKALGDENAQEEFSVDLVQIDTTSNTLSVRAAVNQGTLIRRSADRSVFLVTNYQSGGDGKFVLYNALTDQFSAPQTVSANFYTGSPAVNRNGTLLATQVDGTSIYDSNFKSVQNLPGLDGGLVFDPNQDILYGVNSKLDQIQAWDTNTWTLKYSLPVGEPISYWTAFSTGIMAVSSDGKYLFLTTASGVREYSLPQPTGVAANLAVTGFPAFISTGVPGSVTVSARDPAGNVVPGYRGTVHFSSTSVGNLPADYTFTASDNGSHTFSVALSWAGTQSITVTDAGNAISGSQTGIYVHAPGTNYIPISDYRDLVYDPTRNLLYITTTDGSIQRYDPTTQTLLAPFHINGSLNGADITPDGSALYVADDEYGVAQGWFHHVNLSTGAVTNLPYDLYGWQIENPFGSWDVVIGPNGKALADETTVGISGAVTVPLEQITLANDTLSPRSDFPSVSPLTALARSADRSLLVVAGGTSFSVSATTYSPATDSFPHSTSNPFGNPAVNRNGTLIAAGNVIYDSSLNPVHTLSGVYGGMCFSPTQDVLYVADVNSNNLIAYDTNTWAVKFEIPIGESMGQFPFMFTSGTMALSSDGNLLFLATPTKIRIFGVTPSLSVSGLGPSVTAGTPGSVTVKVVDPSGTTLTGYTGTVHFSSSDQQAGLPADYTFTTADQGSHTFPNVILKTAGTQSITVTDAANALSGTLTGIVVNPAAPDHLAFSLQPSNVRAGAVMSPAVQVQLFDHYGNLASNDSSDQVTLSVASGPGGLDPTSTASVSASSGVAAFSNLVLDTLGTYTLGATATGNVSGPNSNSFTVSAGVADHLAFRIQPSDAVAGTTLTPAVQVQVLDHFGNLLSSDNTDQVTLNVASGPAGFPSGTTTTATVSGGLAGFSNLVLDTAGSYTLAASSGSLTGATSNTFTISPAAADHLTFSVQPSSTLAGAAISPAIQVKVFDPFGNFVSSDNSDQVTLALGSNPAGGTLIGTRTVTVSGGIAHFADLSVDTPGSGYTLTAFGSGLNSATSAAFTIRVPPPTHLAFSVQPADTTAGHALASVEVQLLDQFGNVVSGDSSDQVTLSVASGPGGFDPSSTITVTASGGVAAFSDLVLDTVGTYTLAATATAGLTGSNSNGFTVSPAAPDHLAFSVQPGDAAAGAVLSPAIQVQVFDQFGNFASNDNSDPVTLTMAGGPGGFASGTTTVTASGGVASFGDLVLDTAGTYTLAAGSGNLAGSNSTSFTIRPLAADHLFFAVQPSDSLAGSPINPAVKVQVADKFGNLLPTDNTDRVTLSIATGPGAFSSSNSATATVQAGVATFSNLVLTSAGTYTLAERTTSGLRGPNSGSFTVSAGKAAQLIFLAQPGDGTAGVALPTAVKLQLQDRYGNPLSGDNSDPVTLAVASGPGDFDGSSTTRVTVQNGVATFGNLVLDTGGTYTLAASSSGSVSSPTSDSFTIVAAAADHLIFSIPPPNTTAGVPIAPAVQVVDRFGNPISSESSDQMSVTVASGPGVFASGSTTTATASAGVATFPSLLFARAGNYTLAASDTDGLKGVTSAAFKVSPGPLAQLAFAGQPLGGSAGQALAPAVTVQLFDAFDNPLTDDSSDSVTLNVASGPGPLASGSTAPVMASKGVATFSNVVLTKAGLYTLGASSSSVNAPPSNSFTISAAAANQLAFVQEPGLASAGQPLAPAVQVAVEDAFGNVVPGDTSSVTLALGSNPGAAGLGGTLTQPAVNGVASFPDLSVNGGGTGLTLQASDGSLGPATSAAFTVGQVRLAGDVVSEFRPVGSWVGRLVLDDGSISHVVKYSLVPGPGSDDNSAFSILNNELHTATVFDFTARSQYSIRVRGTDEKGQSFEHVLTVGIVADPHLSLNGKVLTVTGRKGNDSFSFTPGAVWDSLILNGVRLAADPAQVSTVIFQGGGGSDSATLNAGAGNSTLSLSPGQGTLTGKGYSVRLVGVAHVVVNAGKGKTTAALAGGPEADTFAGTPAQATLSGRGVYFQANGFQNVTVTGGGGNDSATLHGGKGKNLFTGAGKSAVLAGSTYWLGLSGFRKVTVYATAGAVNKKVVHSVDYAFVAMGKWS